MLALQALCVREALDESFEQRLGEFLRDPQVLEELEIAPGDADDVVRYARELVLGVFERRAALDEALQAAATNWSLPRMPPVDRNTLRLGLFELDRPDIPAAVAISEAVALAARFGDRESPSFINGVLDALHRKARVSGTVEAKAPSDDAGDARGEDRLGAV